MAQQMNPYMVMPYYYPQQHQDILGMGMMKAADYINQGITGRFQIQQAREDSEKMGALMDNMMKGDPVDWKKAMSEFKTPDYQKQAMNFWAQEQPIQTQIVNEQGDVKPGPMMPYKTLAHGIIKPSIDPLRGIYAKAAFDSAKQDKDIAAHKETQQMITDRMMAMQERADLRADRRNQNVLDAIQLTADLKNAAENKDKRAQLEATVNKNYADSVSKMEDDFRSAIKPHQDLMKKMSIYPADSEYRKTAEASSLKMMNSELARIRASYGQVFKIYGKPNPWDNPDYKMPGAESESPREVRPITPNPPTATPAGGGAFSSKPDKASPADWDKYTRALKANAGNPEAVQKINDEATKLWGGK